MAFYDVYSHPALVRYRSSVCAKATLFALLCSCLTYIPPLLVAYRSQGFWLKLSSYEEQPVVRFQYELLLTACTSAQGDQVGWATYAHYNHLLGPRLRIPSVTVREEDQNHDGKLDVLQLKLQLPLKPEEQIYNLQLLLSFNYQLFRMSTVAMQSLVYVHSGSATPGSRLFVSGDLRLQQRGPLPHRGLHNVYNVSVIDSSSPFASDYEFGNILRKYQQRNLTTALASPVIVWTPGRGSSSTFELSAEIHYSTDTITYRPGFWETMKFAWIQYVSVLLLFLWFFRRIQTFVFEKHLLPTVPRNQILHHKVH